MDKLIYFIITLLATTIGSVTGMGGGIIIKPVLDSFGQYDLATIGLLSSVSVFAMSSSSILRNIIQKTKVPVKLSIFLGIGSVIGGSIGSYVLDELIGKMRQGVVGIIQNVFLGSLLVLIIIYMKNKNKMKSFKITNSLLICGVGIVLGGVSSFLGIGGGPFNVAIIILLFSLSTKTATYCSLITIFCAQLAKLTPLALNGSLADYDLQVMPYMVIGAVIGGLIGTALNSKLLEQQVDRLFNVVQIVILLIVSFNIVKLIG